MNQNFNYSFDEYIEAKSLIIHEIAGDGHCLINAVAFNLKSLNYYQIIESLKLESNSSEWQQFYFDKTFKFKDDMQNYIYNKFWDQEAIDIVPLMISKITKTNINIFKINTDDSFNVIIISHEKTYDNFISVMLKNNHYSAIQCYLNIFVFFKLYF